MDKGGRGRGGGSYRVTSMTTIVTKKSTVKTRGGRGRRGQSSSKFSTSFQNKSHRVLDGDDEICQQALG